MEFAYEDVTVNTCSPGMRNYPELDREPVICRSRRLSRLESKGGSWQDSSLYSCLAGSATASGHCYICRLSRSSVSSVSYNAALTLRIPKIGPLLTKSVCFAGCYGSPLGLVRLWFFIGLIEVTAALGSIFTH